MSKPLLMIRHQINLGFVLVLIMALFVIFAVVEFKVKPDLLQQQQQKIAENQSELVDLINARLGQVEVLTRTLAAAATSLPKNESIFKELLPSVIDNRGDSSIAGGGIWPEPGAFSKGIERRSFFWGRENGQLKYVDDYNAPDGAGYHEANWYKDAMGASSDNCIWSQAYVDPFTRTPMVTCSVPIHENNEFAGVATIDVKLGDITRILQRYGEKNDGYAFAIDSSNHMISFPFTAANIESNANSLVNVNELATHTPWLKSSLLRINTTNETGLIELHNDKLLGEAAYVDLVRSDETGWIIGLVLPRSKMTAMADSMGFFLMLAIGALLVAVGVVAAVLFRNLINKIQQTTVQVRQLTDEETSQTLRTGRMNEMGELRQAVNTYGEKLKSLLRHLEDVQDELVQSEKLASLGALVAGVAHELNTPIGNALMSSTSVLDANKQFSKKMNAQMTRRDLANYLEDVTQGATIIERNLARAAELIGAFKQLAVDQTSSQRREFELKGLVEEVSLSMRPSVQKSPCKLEIDVPQCISMDSYPGKLSQVLMNLINNAVIHAFDEQEEGTIQIVASQEQADKVRLTVADNGCGIPDERIKRIFDPFYTTRLGKGGSGLGLHITFNLVTGVLGGRIDVESREDKGSCFTLTLPVIAPHLDDSTRLS